MCGFQQLDLKEAEEAKGGRQPRLSDSNPLLDPLQTLDSLTTLDPRPTSWMSLVHPRLPAPDSQEQGLTPAFLSSSIRCVGCLQLSVKGTR